MAMMANARPPACVLQMPSYSSSNTLLPSSGVTHRRRGRAKDLSYRIPWNKINQFDLFFTLSASLGYEGIMPSVRYAQIGSIQVGLLSNHNASCRSMLLSVIVSHWMFLGFPSSDQLASLDRVSACRFSNQGMCVMVKCFDNLVASRTRWTYAAMTSSFASYAPLS